MRIYMDELSVDRLPISKAILWRVCICMDGTSQGAALFDYIIHVQMD